MVTYQLKTYFLIFRITPFLSSHVVDLCKVGVFCKRAPERKILRVTVAALQPRGVLQGVPFLLGFFAFPGL